MIPVKDLKVDEIHSAFEEKSKEIKKFRILCTDRNLYNKKLKPIIGIEIGSGVLYYFTDTGCDGRTDSSFNDIEEIFELFCPVQEETYSMNIALDETTKLFYMNPQIRQDKNPVIFQLTVKRDKFGNLIPSVARVAFQEKK